MHMLTFLADGKLFALNKCKEGSPPDVRLRRLTGKCICTILRNMISSFIQPSQFGVACKAGAEKIVHSLRRCIEDNWLSDDVVAFKVDMLNAFNMVSRQTVMDEYATSFPELLPWVSWCYGSHSSLWHPTCQVSSQSGVQQGDHLGPVLLPLSSISLLPALDVDDDCFHAPPLVGLDFVSLLCTQLCFHSFLCFITMMQSRQHPLAPGCDKLQYSGSPS